MSRGIFILMMVYDTACLFAMTILEHIFSIDDYNLEKGMYKHE